MLISPKLIGPRSPDLNFRGDPGLAFAFFMPPLEQPSSCLIYGFYCSSNFHLNVFLGVGRKEIRREEAGEGMCS